MAEAILLDMSKSILSQLSSRAIQEIGVWWNAEDELNKLEDTVITIQAVLLDAEEEDQPSNQFKHWLGKLRHVLYDAEELADDFSTQAMRRQVMKENVVLPKEVRLFFSRSNQFVFGNKLGHKIKAIRETLDAITNDRQKFHFAVRRTKTPFFSKGRDQIISLQERENIASFQREENVIGRESEKKEIIDILLKLKSDAKDRVSVLPIVGTGGLGKTTLAKSIHDDEKVKSQFDVRMWVYVGYVDLSIKEIGEKAIKSAIDRNDSKLLNDPKVEANVGEEKGLGDPQKKNQKEFKDVIGGKFFLLVLDDVWSEDRTMWSNLENLWRNGTLESRIMITTRSLKVAEMTSKLEPYKLGDLSFSDSLTLFVNIVFEGQEKKKQDVKAIVEKSKKQDLKTIVEKGSSEGQESKKQDVADYVETIVEKCAGVPLAIKAIGNMLYFLNPETEWLPFVTNELSKYPQTNKDIFSTLRLSYDHLPSPLKYCFTYCKLFPKGYEIKVKTLVQLWIAQGYIKPSDLGESLEDIGLHYCKVLVSRSFLEEGNVDELGNLISCRMHDIMHDLASFLEGDEIVIASKSSGEIIKKNTHHMSVDLNNFNKPFKSLEFLKSVFQAKKLRTLITSKSDLKFGSIGIEVNQCDEICKKLKSLLVLKLSDNELKKIPNSISNLKHLRYLDFSRSREIKILPNSITRLINLQVLKLHYCRRLEELPKDINKLVNLKYLSCVGCNRLKYMPCGLGQLTLLETLPLFVLRAQKHTCSLSPFTGASKYIGGPAELKELNSLTGSLKIRNVKCISECEAANLKEKQSLESLTVVWDDKVDGKDEELQSFHLPPNLKIFYIVRYKGERFPVWHEATTDFPQFSCLSNLTIFNCPNLNLETIPEPSKLQNLKVVGIEVATMFPNWLSSLTNLVEIRLRRFKRCKHLPPLDQIPTLQIIQIYDFPDLEYIEIGSGQTFFESLKSLYLENCEKLKGWRKKGEHHDDDTSTTTSTADLPQFLSLSQLTIDNCPQLIWESFLHQISSLQQLQIFNFPDLEYIEIGSGPTFFPSLESLYLENCGKLKGWRKKGEHHDDTSTTTSTADLPQFHSLSQLAIINCPQLILETFLPPLDQIPSLQLLQLLNFPDLEYIEIGSGPTFFPSLKTLYLDNCGKLKGWGKKGEHHDDTSTTTSTADLPQFQSLSELTICSCPQLILQSFLPPLDQIPSLQLLYLYNSPDLEYIEIGSGPSLNTLWLYNCPNLKGWTKDGDKKQLPQFPRLSELRISHCPNLKMPLFPTLDVTSLDVLLYLNDVNKEILVRTLSDLKRLFIECRNLESLPTELLQNLTSLQSLTIAYCPSLTHLPQEMQCLTSLQELNIMKCPQLGERCGNKKGVDWPNIAHIPNIQIDGRDIQEKGNYQLDNHSSFLSCL